MKPVRLFAIIATFIALGLPLPAIDRPKTSDTIIDQWYLARDSIITLIDTPVEDGIPGHGLDATVIREMNKLKSDIRDFRNDPAYRFMIVGDDSLEGILASLEAEIAVAIGIIAREHTADEVFRSLTSIQIALSDYMRYRIYFSEKVTRYYMFIILFFVSVCVLIVVLIAIFKVRLSSLERNEANTAKFARTVINAQESERIAIARELHDTVAQDILCIKVSTETMRSAIAKRGNDYDAAFAELIGTETACINRIREVCAELRPPELVHLGLKAAVGGLCDAFEKATGIRCSSVLYGDFSLGYEEEINCYRIVQEALSNIRKHAKATSVRVHTDRIHEPEGPGKLLIRISDDGVGISRKDAETPAKGKFGLKGMRERVRILRGDLSIEGESSGGTTISITIPLTAKTAGGYNDISEKSNIS